MYYKIEKDGKIFCIGEQDILPDGLTQITEDEYNEILQTFTELAERIQKYVDMVIDGSMNIEDIESEDERKEVENIISSIPTNSYGIDDDTYNAIIDDYTMELLEGGIIA